MTMTVAFRPTSKQLPELQLCEQKTGLTCALLLCFSGEGELQHVCQLSPECGMWWACSLLSEVVGTAVSQGAGAAEVYSSKFSSHGLSVNYHQSLHKNCLFLVLTKMRRH